MEASIGTGRAKLRAGLSRRAARRRLGLCARRARQFGRRPTAPRRLTSSWRMGRPYWGQARPSPNRPPESCSRPASSASAAWGCGSAGGPRRNRRRPIQRPRRAIVTDRRERSAFGDPLREPRSGRVALRLRPHSAAYRLFMGRASKDRSGSKRSVRPDWVDPKLRPRVEPLQCPRSYGGVAIRIPAASLKRAAGSLQSP
jgi:hypothetical protein